MLNVAVHILLTMTKVSIPLLWRHNELDSVSNHQSHNCLLNQLLRHRSKKHQNSASLTFVRGIHRSTVNSPHKGQWRGKCFHLMTPSCATWFSVHKTLAYWWIYASVNYFSPDMNNCQSIHINNHHWMCRAQWYKTAFKIIVSNTAATFISYINGLLYSNPCHTDNYITVTSCELRWVWNHRRLNVLFNSL